MYTKIGFQGKDKRGTISTLTNAINKPEYYKNVDRDRGTTSCLYDGKAVGQKLKSKNKICTEDSFRTILHTEAFEQIERHYYPHKVQVVKTNIKLTQAAKRLN